MQVPNLSHLPRPVMTQDALDRFIASDFPQALKENSGFEITVVDHGTVTVRLFPDDRHLRPGGTVSGPSLFALADCAAYFVILAHIGPVGLTVTTNLNINFVNKAAPGFIDCTANLLKLGSRLAVTEMYMTDHDEWLISQATGTYSIPPNRVK